jgi:acyl-CoA thioesterase YciA
MSFQRPVFVGDEVSCSAKILKVGCTSITVQVQAFARRDRSGEAIKVTEGVFTYVAMNEESKPRSVDLAGERTLVGRA